MEVFFCWEYYQLCKIDTRLPENPYDQFKNKFKTWTEYFNIDENYYDLHECKIKISQYIDKDTDLNNPKEINLMIQGNLKKYTRELSILCEKLSEIDKKFPSDDMWVDYYKVKNLEEIFNDLTKKKKQRKLNILYGI